MVAVHGSPSALGSHAGERSQDAAAMNTVFNAFSPFYSVLGLQRAYLTPTNINKGALEPFI